MGNCCGSCGGGDISGGRGGRSNREDSGDIVVSHYACDQLTQNQIQSVRPSFFESSSRREAQLDLGLSARPFIKGTCSVVENEDGGGRGGVDSSGGGSNNNNVQ